MQCQSCGGRTELTGQVYLPDGRVVCRACAPSGPAAAQAPAGMSTRDVLLIVLAIVIAIGGAGLALGYRKNAPTDADVAAARQQVEVTMYFTTWCPACKQAHRWLETKNYKVTMVDVEADPEAAQRMAEINPRGTIPTFDMGNGVVLVGFTPKSFEQKLDEAARRKTGD